MLLLRQSPSLVLRSLTARLSQPVRNFSKDNDDASSSDDEKEPKHTKAKQRDTEKKAAKENKEEPAVARLNRLLASMQTEDNLSVGKKIETNMARPGEIHKKKKEAAKQEAANKDIFVAAQRVASLLGEDSKKTESELLEKLLGHGQQHGETKINAAPKPENDSTLSELIVGMKIDRSEKPREERRSEYVRRTLSARSPKQQQNQQLPRVRKDSKREAEAFTGNVNLFGSTPLGIFKNPSELREMPDILDTWAHLEEHELNLQIAHPPANYYEKIALWTEKGKVWRFPIDNEQDLQEEINVDFSEHIFLEQHLEAWCPTRGPVRHFMELVCVGLSKNPYLTAKEKKDHILWYKDYFEAKKELLQDLMSREKATALQSNTNQLES